MQTIPARVIATIFALACFAGAIALGVYNGNSAFSILLGAVLVMIAAFVVGLILGTLMQRCVDDHVKQHQADHPIPGDASYVPDNPDNPNEPIGTADAASQVPAGT